LTSPPDPDHHAFEPAPPISTTFATRPGACTLAGDGEALAQVLHCLRANAGHIAELIHILEAAAVTPVL
jgi:hypothetical protein